ncbi:iron-sulfur cluster repair di-iron protein [Variovorax sp. PBS-H4]|uniref:hemerythrin domain-containing protein n=1 Tax=Variovorax sp. PBS-H4 TaxID=434008 RepID=UPI001318B196|nr:hemerythrin domain-containing protein [Variovorax sp. PBS-H4]VTU35333.1 iron-sulfur cluster repair di-iron protein [Variovorax sp. PBS-H4]
MTTPDRSLPTGGFEVPLEMLSACHGRIEHQCATLRRLVPHMARHGADLDARSAAAAVMRYFDTAAKHHHEDEEQDLFPALVESMAGSDPVCLREMTQGLVAEHREIEARWLQVRAVLEQIAAGRTVPLDPDDVETLARLYERHMEREEQELLPMAARLLSDEELQRIGRAMRERRGIQLPD